MWLVGYDVVNLSIFIYFTRIMWNYLLFGTFVDLRRNIYDSAILTDCSWPGIVVVRETRDLIVGNFVIYGV